MSLEFGLLSNRLRAFLVPFVPSLILFDPAPPRFAAYGLHKTSNRVALTASQLYAELCRHLIDILRS